jgi:plasmid stability protein
MASLTIRNLDASIKASLRLRAAIHGRSMEEEARQILRQALLAPPSGEGLGSRIHRRFAAVGGVELPEVQRSPARPAPDFQDLDIP